MYVAHINHLYMSCVCVYMHIQTMLLMLFVFLDCQAGHLLASTSSGLPSVSMLLSKVKTIELLTSDRT